MKKKCIGRGRNARQNLKRRLNWQNWADDLVKQREIVYEKLKKEQKLELDRQARDYQLQIEQLKLMVDGRLSAEGGRERDHSGDLVSNLKLITKFNERDPEVFFFRYLRVWPMNEAGRVLTGQLCCSRC